MLALPSRDKNLNKTARHCCFSLDLPTNVDIAFPPPTCCKLRQFHRPPGHSVEHDQKLHCGFSFLVNAIQLCTL